ncbi:MAG: diaminopimelate decarboxylase [Anderseniella sp.]
MHHFSYKDGILHAEDINLADLTTDIETPFYCYSTATLTRHHTVLKEAFHDLDLNICYAMKANSNQAVIKTLADLGAGMDVVSEGELRRARAAGVPARKIVFSGVGKTASEMALALREGIACFNVESEPELDMLSAVATRLGETATISIRVNPDVDAKTHAKITTGKYDNKFGIPMSRAREVYDHAAKLPSLKVSGVDCHIGSQITSLAPYEQAYSLIADLVEDLRRDGHAITHVDFGGGLGVPYRGTNDVPPHPDEYADVVRKTLGHLECKFIMEPGRMIAGNAGILVARVIHVKQGEGKRFIIIDAAMNDLIRPTLYDAWHDIIPIRQPNPDTPSSIADVVGPVCESGDFMAQDRQMPHVEPGDLIAIMTAGAYGAVQAGTYNSRLLIPEVLVNGQRFAVVRPRQSYEALIGLDRLASWQQ